MHDADVHIGLTSLGIGHAGIFVTGFSSHNANCTCMKPSFSTQLDLDLVYITEITACIVVFIDNVGTIPLTPGCEGD